jgi:hypothetical protein
MIETAEFVTPKSIEATYRRSVEFKDLPDNERHRLQEQALRAAKARDSRLLLVLDKGLEIMHKQMEDQLGRTQRSTNEYSLRVPPAEYNYWKAAYEAIDKGDPLVQLTPIYVAAGQLAGVVM